MVLMQTRIDRLEAQNLTLRRQNHALLQLLDLHQQLRRLELRGTEEQVSQALAELNRRITSLGELVDELVTPRQ